MRERYILEIKLWDAMQRKKISVKELSAASGVSKSEIYHICQNEKNPTLYTMLALAKAMEADLSELYDFKEKIPS